MHVRRMGGMALVRDAALYDSVDRERYAQFKARGEVVPCPAGNPIEYEIVRHSVAHHEVELGMAAMTLSYRDEGVKALYDRLPVFAQNAAATFYGLRQRRQIHGAPTQPHSHCFSNPNGGTRRLSSPPVTRNAPAS